MLLDIYVEYGFSKEFTVNVVKPGKSGAEEIKAMMENFRANPPKELGGSKVILSKDYKTLKQTDAEGKVTDLDMPETSNVLQYFTEDGSKVSVRPWEQNEDQILYGSTRRNGLSQLFRFC